MQTHRLSDIARTRPWYTAQRRQNRKYLRRSLLTATVIIVFFSIAFYRMVQSIPPIEEHPPQTVHELLEAIRPQIME